MDKEFATLCTHAACVRMRPCLPTSCMAESWVLAQPSSRRPSIVPALGRSWAPSPRQLLAITGQASMADHQMWNRVKWLGRTACMPHDVMVQQLPLAPLHPGLHWR